MQRSSLVKWVLVLLLIVLSFVILKAASAALIPPTLAGLLAILFIPLSNLLERKGIVRGFAAFICVLIFLIVFAGILALFSWQLANIVNDVSSIEKTVSTQLQNMQHYLSNQFGIKVNVEKTMMQQQGGKAAALIAGFMGSVLNVLLNIVLLLVYMFLMLYLRSHIKKFILKLVNNSDEGKAKKIIAESSSVTQKYLVGLITMIAMLWVMYGIGFSLIGVKSALFFAVVCGTLEIIPFVGNLTGTSLAVIMVLSQGGGLSMVISVVVVYAVVQFIQSYLIQPYIVGGEVNINPLSAIFVLVIGEMVWGISGMILAIPVLAIIKIVFDNIDDLKPYGYLIGGDKKKSDKTLVQKVKGWFGKSK